MNQQLLKACSEGDLELFNALILDNPNILMSVTPAKNNCLHLAAMLGYNEFAKEVWSRDSSLFLRTNRYGETPLVAALAAANVTLASDMIAAAKECLQPDMEGGMYLKAMLLMSDVRGNSVLHHAMQNGFEDFAVQLLNEEPLLSEQVNMIEESPMHVAVRRGYSKVLCSLLNIPTSSNSGPGSRTALHAAVEAGRPDIINQLLKGPGVRRRDDWINGFSPLTTAVLSANLKIVKILLEHFPDVAYDSGEINTNAFLLAACNGSVPIAKEILRVCPDSAYANNELGRNALHLAVFHDQADFVGYILRTPKLHRLINQPDFSGDLPLHIAADFCLPKILRLLLNYKNQDYTAPNIGNRNAVDIIYTQNTRTTKTLKWNECYTLMTSSFPSALSASSFAIEKAKLDIKKEAVKEINSLTGRYTTNTSLVAALLATITFAAAFTLPGGYSNDASNAGLPIFAMKAAFQVFLISDTIAMCSSLAVTFLCVLATWEDLDFLLNYRKTTRALMWCAYVATVVAFGTGLFTVLAPKHLWLAVLILVFSCSVPFLSKIIGEWPLIMLRLRLGHLFRKDLIPNI